MNLKLITDTICKEAYKITYLQDEIERERNKNYPDMNLINKNLKSIKKSQEKINEFKSKLN